MMKDLTGRQRRFLRSRAQSLDAILVVGKEGITDAVTTATVECFNRRELVKVRFREADPDARRELASTLAAQTGTHLVQMVGRVAVYYRPAPKGAKVDDPIHLPRG